MPLSVLNEAQQRAEQLWKSAETFLHVGLIDARTALEAEREWRQARGAWVAASYLALRRLVETFRAVGGGWDKF